MASKIAWTEETWELTGGCDKCSVGCQECYALKLIWRFAHNPSLGDRYHGLVEKINGKLNWTGKIKLFEDRLEQPLKRKKPTTYFVCPRSDLFHPDVPFIFIEKVMAVIEECPQHNFIFLSKRSMTEYFLSKQFELSCCPNLIGMATIENQEQADIRVPDLLQCGFATTGLSVEPMLGQVSLRWLAAWPENAPTTAMNPYNNGNTNELDGLRRLDWVIIGAESGANRRECKIEHVINLVEQCKAAGVPVFVKQIHINGKIVKDINLFPEDLRFRQYPKELNNEKRKSNKQG